ncbi:MAG: ATP-binding protein [Deltaproteobacteria bacterium]|nr:ATP-binding protein [Deltaproteobacteria bacterium]
MIARSERLRALVARRGEVSNRDVAGMLRISPATSHRLLRALVTAGVLELHGKGPAARYCLRHIRFRFRRVGLEEDRAWNAIAEAMARVQTLPTDELRSLQYAVSEVLNNAVEHSRGRSVSVDVSFESRGTCVVTVRDDGVGVFRRVCKDFGFTSPQEAILQLEKGKLTSDPARHSGEGLFFTSKAVSLFRIESQGVAWIVDNLVGDSAIGASDTRKGTRVVLTVLRDRTPTLEDVFRSYTDPKSLRFTRTRTTVKLGAFGTTLISRSEARRITRRFTDFTHAVLDFSGVEIVGQGFCDEVFRVFARQNPQVKIEPLGMNDAVAFMVARAQTT